MKFICTALLAISIQVSSAQAEIRRYRQVSETVFRGSQPETFEDYEALKSAGIKTLLNLRTSDPAESGEVIQAARLGMKVLWVPMNPLLPINNDDVNRILAYLNGKKPGSNQPQIELPIFVHCHEGKDRTGMIIGLYRVETQNWLPANAYDEMLSLDFNTWLVPLDIYFRKRTGYDPD